MIEYSFVRSNIIQFNIVQAIGALDDELRATIYWYSLSLPAIFFIFIIGEVLIKLRLQYALSTGLGRYSQHRIWAFA